MSSLLIHHKNPQLGPEAGWIKVQVVPPERQMTTLNRPNRPSGFPHLLRLRQIAEGAPRKPSSIPTAKPPFPPPENPDIPMEIKEYFPPPIILPSCV